MKITYRRLSTFLIFASGFLWSPLNAQTVPPNSRVLLVVQDTVRQSSPFNSNASRLVGEAGEFTADSVFLRVAGSNYFGVHRSSIQAVYVSQGVSRFRSAAKTGLLAAATALLVLYQPAGDDSNTQRNEALVGAGVALAAGAFVGAIRPYEHWKRLR